MAVTVACIAGEEITRQWDAGRISGERLSPRETPFGRSGQVLLIEGAGQDFYLMPRYGAEMRKTAPRKINDRANMYALKDLGVQCVLAWGPGGAITHNVAVGDLVVLNDVIDQTYLRRKTFFEDSPLGYLRQFPVFCPTLRRVVSEVLDEMKLVHHETGTAAVREGPRLETPAEVRMLAAVGAEIVTHTFVPEVFLAKELQLCYAAICYVANYAESGKRRRPIAAGNLFGGLTDVTESDRLAGAVTAMSEIVRKVAASLPSAQKNCECDQTMAA
ncbi:MAG: MTAP family purine nucleoside phosphorylase, partial [Planctomycetota bacterium]|nr:MTAP family purine nucleoside phosphorylase [Planctomycetota bacterium]